MYHFKYFALFVALGAAACSGSSAEDARQSRAAISALPCGTPLAEIDGVAAYSNGAGQGNGNIDCNGIGEDGDQYQCVELAQRYFRKHFGIWLQRKGTAAEMCGIEQEPDVTVHREAGYVPVHGDLIVLGGGVFGHVAVVDSVSGAAVNVVEQNASLNGTSVYWIGSQLCFIHANANGAAASNDPCATAPIDAWYCGGHDITGDSSTLYLCHNGRLSAQQPCAYGCVPVPGNADDMCASAPASSCDCDGVDEYNNPVHTTQCGYQVCGLDHQIWTCVSSTNGGFTGGGGYCN